MCIRDRCLPVAVLRIVLSLQTPVGRRNAPELRGVAWVHGIRLRRAGWHVLHISEAHPEVVDLRAHGHHVLPGLLL
eukprot:13938012-Alexandrium_andersonii.AAC.1